MKYSMKVILIILCRLAWVYARVRPRLHLPGMQNAYLSNNVWSSSGQRPFYNIAHMCNSIKKTLTHLSRGANAVEVDVEFRNDDIYLYHGQPCDCFRYCWDSEPFGKYLEFVRKATTNRTAEDGKNINYLPNFTLLYFDTKLKSFTNEEKYFNGIRLADYLARYFYNNLHLESTIKLVVSIYYVTDVDFLVGFITRMKELNLYEATKHKIGYDVGTNSDIDEIRSMWRRLNITNIWQGEGISNCFNPIIGHTLDRLIEERDNDYSNLSKVYRWTVDLTDSIRLLLRYNIDGIMTNHPERIIKIINEPEFIKFYRMATIYDDPFTKHNPYNSPDWRQSIDKNVNTINLNTIVRLFNDIKNSFYHFILEVFESIFTKSVTHLH